MSNPGHPGIIVFENLLDGTRREQHVDQVPESVAFVELDGQRVPVVRIVMSGDGDQRRIESFAEDGRLLSITVGDV